jgi:hypothetical protein
MQRGRVDRVSRGEGWEKLDRHVVWWLWIGLTGKREREVLTDPSLLCREAEWTGSVGEGDRYGWTGMLLWWQW